LNADVQEMGLTPALFARDTVSASALKNFRLVIFDDQGNAAHKYRRARSMRWPTHLLRDFR